MRWFIDSSSAMGTTRTASLVTLRAVVQVCLIKASGRTPSGAAGGKGL